MVLEDPKPQLLPNLGFANPLDYLDAGFTQDDNALAGDARVRISHADHDSRHAAGSDRFRAGRRAPMERARLERRIESRSGHTAAARFPVAPRASSASSMARRIHGS